jgi:outer membrane receptor protein involved in Fe transport
MSVYRWVAAAIFCALLPAAAAAQIETGRISGNVRDASGAWVSDATVTVTNEKTGETRSARTHNDGFFVIAPLKASAYTIKATKDGFAIIEYTKVPVAVGQELSLDFEFKPAGVQESVDVTAVAPVLDITSARIGANVSEREVQSLPVNGRQMSQLMLQAPGSQNAGSGTWQDIRFSGRAVEQNVIRYDGIEGSAIIDAAPGVLNGEISSPFKLQASLENVQEFRVESSGYPAEYGTGTGGQVSVVTKSGGNDFRGSVFEYLRHEALDAPNHFDSTRRPDDSVIDELDKSKLRQNQYGASIGGPLVRNRAFFFGSYEGYRLNAGTNAVEAVPSDLAWSEAVPAIAALRPGFLASNAVVLPGASTNPMFDIAQLQAEQTVRENSFAGRLDLRLSDKWTSYVRVFHDVGTSNQFEGVSGRVVRITDNPSNAVFNLQGIIGDGMVNEFKFGYNAAPTTIVGQAPVVNGIDFSALAINLSGSIANNGIAGQSGSSGITIPGGLVRANSATNGHASPYDPYSLTFADSLNRIAGNHLFKAGTEVRMVRMKTDRIGGTTYSFSGIDQFLANTPANVQYVGNLSDASVFNHGAAGPRHTEQQYYVGYVQDEWRLRPDLTLNLGLRYDYYTVLRERDDLIVKFNIDTGVIDPPTTPEYTSKKNNVQPRLSLTYSPLSSTVFRGGFGIFVGPGQTEDQIQPVESDVIRTTISSGAAFPLNIETLRANFTNNPDNRQFQPRAYANEYTIPERIYQYTASVQQELPGRFGATIAYVGSQGRNLFLRSIANRTIGVESNGAAAGTQVREFDVVTCANGIGGTGILCPGSSIASIQRPFAEVDYKTSGGHDSYNAMQLSLTRRVGSGLTMNGQYTLGYSKGNTGGSNEATTAANNARAIPAFDYDNGYNNFDVRHTFNLSAIYTTPGSGFSGGWSVGGILNARSGLPVPVLITRPDIVYVDEAGHVFNNPAADRTAVMNTPGGGSSRSTRRPDLIPGVDPYIKEGGLVFLNPAAFAAPAPGAFGNLERNQIHGPSTRQLDLVVSKRVNIGRGPNVEFRAEIFNVFNTTNFKNPPATLANPLPNNSLTEANKLQPGQSFTSAAAGASFGVLNSTAERIVGLGTNRQTQLAIRVNF